MTAVYIVVCHDRRCDDDITAHTTRESADAKVEAFKATYATSKHDRVWVERNYGQPQWCRFTESANDDGPRARIEVSELQGKGEDPLSGSRCGCGSGAVFVDDDEPLTPEQIAFFTGVPE